MDARFNGSAAAAHSEFTQQFGEALARFPERAYVADFLMGGSIVRSHIVGAELHTSFVKAFAHLQLPAGQRVPKLTVHLFDATDTGIGESEIAADYDPALAGEVVAAPDGQFVYFGRPQLRTVLDRVNASITGAVGSAGRLTLYDLGRPLHSELLLWHHDQQLLPVHAGLVAREGQGVLLAGPGGSGKSTTSIMCHLAGFAYLADDYVAVEWNSDGNVTGHSVYNSSHIEPEHLKKFPALVSAGATSGSLTREDKSLVILSDLEAGNFAHAATIRVIGLPRVAHTPTTAVRRASKVEALMRLAPSSLFLLPYAGMSRDGFAKLNDLVNRLPAYWLELGEDLAEIPAVVDEILAQEMSRC